MLLLFIGPVREPSFVQLEESLPQENSAQHLWQAGRAGPATQRPKKPCQFPVPRSSPGCRWKLGAEALLWRAAFCQAASKAFLMVVSVALAAFALGVSDSGSVLAPWLQLHTKRLPERLPSGEVPMPLIGGAFFQSASCLH